jgi:N-ethylmaleimide reductase
MAPLTRSRAGQPGDVPTALNAEYYRQRAGAGLIISEATYVHPLGRAYAFIPGIVTDAQVAGWRLVTDAVHDEGGRIFLQLFHGGRIGHVDLLDGAQPVAPSAARANSQTYTMDSEGMVDVSEPRALTTEEIADVVRQFADGAQRAIDAGFDGVEIHGANGYLVDQFTRDGTNNRDDAYGGSLANRLRFPLAVAKAAADRIGADRVGFRVSPHSGFNGMSDSDPLATYTALAEGLGALGLAYLEHVEIGGDEADVRQLAAAMRDAFKRAGGGAFIANAAYTRDSAAARISAGEADAVTFGVPFLANPDLPARFRKGADLNEADQATFYGGDAKGYIDYPTLEEASV